MLINLLFKTLIQQQFQIMICGIVIESLGLHITEITNRYNIVIF